MGHSSSRYDGFLEEAGEKDVEYIIDTWLVLGLE